MLLLPHSEVVMQCDGDTLRFGPAALTHSQLSELVTHRAVQRGEILRDRSLPQRLVPYSAPPWT